MDSAPAGRRCLVTGGTSVIGQAIVRRLCADGYATRFTYAHDLKSAKELSSSTGAIAIYADFLEVGWEIEGAGESILVNNAGINLSGHSIFETPDEELRQSFEVNLYAPLKLSRMLGTQMAKEGWGRVINMNSLWGIATAANRFSYAASKHALRALTTTLALELAPNGVTVNEICPAAVQTRMLEQMADIAIGQGRYQSLAEYLTSCSASIPSGRLVSPESIAATVSFLCSEAASDITGQSIRVSGGADL